jgi:hypothetical protein
MRLTLLGKCRRENRRHFQIVQKMQNMNAVATRTNSPDNASCHAEVRVEVDPSNRTTRDVKLIRDHCSIPRSIMTGTKKRHSAAFRARVALEAAKQTRTLAELSGAFQIHSVQLIKWKKQLLDGIE